MLFNSYTFIFLFLPITWLVYQLLRQRHAEAALGWLVVASLFFYSYWNPAYLLLILASIGGNYIVGQLLSGLFSSGRERALRGALALGITLNLVALGYFKYADFFISTLNEALDASVPLQHVVLPLAISFFTFQQITYLVDTARGLTSEHKFVHYALYVTFFPQLIAGPIVHHKEMLPQFTLTQKLGVRQRDIAVGLTIFFMGLFKKVVIADSIAPYANEVFDAVAAGRVLSTGDAWTGALAYTFQLYFDFSGYADMAIGAARLFGIRLPLNFNSPYKSDNIIEFWRRWHMTLSTFLRDYLYIPLGGNRQGPARRYVNLMITMLLGGLWHGAGWTFVCWGFMHGAYLCLNHGWRRLTGGTERWMPLPLAAAVSRGITFAAVVVAWVMFRADNFPSAWSMIESMFFIQGNELNIHRFSETAPALLALVAWVFFMPNTQELLRYYRPTYERVTSATRLAWRPSAGWAVLLILMAIVSLTRLSKMNEFLYFQF